MTLTRTYITRVFLPSFLPSFLTRTTRVVRSVNVVAVTVYLYLIYLSIYLSIYLLSIYPSEDLAHTGR